MGTLSTVQQRWQYDARGHVSRADYTNIAGLADPTSFSYSYDSGERLAQLTYPSGEVLTYSYDGAWRLASAATSLGGSYVSSAHYTALDQPADRGLGNGWAQTWGYSAPLARLSSLVIGPSGGAAAFNRSYGYDPVGNVAGITNTVALPNEVQTFGYDARDRLGNWTSSVGGVNQSYTYNAIGNLTSKAGVAYTYGPQAPLNGGPHAVLSAGTTSYTYDAVGNMTGSTGSPGRSYSWNADNQPTSITSGGATEQYAYDGDGERLSRTHGALTTFYLAGIQEVDVRAGSRWPAHALPVQRGKVATRTPGGSTTCTGTTWAA